MSIGKGAVVLQPRYVLCPCIADRMRGSVVCDAQEFPNRCSGFANAKTAKANMLAPDDDSWKTDHWPVQDEYVDVMDVLWDMCWRERNTKHGPHGETGCDYGGCMADAAGIRASTEHAHSPGSAKLTNWPHWGDEGIPDRRVHTHGKLPLGGGPNAPPHYDYERKEWIGRDSGQIPIDLAHDAEPHHGPVHQEKQRKKEEIKAKEKNEWQKAQELKEKKEREQREKKMKEKERNKQKS